MVIASGNRVVRQPVDIVLNSGYLVPLSGGMLPTALSMSQRITLQEDSQASRSERWQVSLLSYRYTLLDPTTEREWLAFHWHPGREGAEHPHVHPGSAILSRQELAGRHIPTGRITLSDVLSFAIVELGVQPERTDWRRVLAEVATELADR